MNILQHMVPSVMLGEKSGSIQCAGCISVPSVVFCVHRISGIYQISRKMSVALPVLGHSMKDLNDSLRFLPMFGEPFGGMNFLSVFCPVGKIAMVRKLSPLRSL
jgi:hypothetical protein